MRGISWLAENQLASPERLCSMEKIWSNPQAPDQGTVSRSFMNVANSVLWMMAIILKFNKVNLFVSSVLFVFWYHSPNFLDTPRINEELSVIICVCIMNKQIHNWLIFYYSVLNLSLLHSSTLMRHPQGALIRCLLSYINVFMQSWWYSFQKLSHSFI
jgi:hypothetical protein